MIEQGINRVAIIGAGLMGLGIGVEFARFGYGVNLYNTSRESSDGAMAQAGEDLDLMVETELVSRDEATAAYDRLRPTTDLAEAVAGADYVVESVLEFMSLKREIFALLDELCPPPVILATNTSRLPVSEIASATAHPERVLATHYFQPPHFIPLVEVAPGQKTDGAVIEKVAGMLRAMRKKVVVMETEVAGFIGNRIQLSMRPEIQDLVDKGICTPQTIDDVISFGFGRRMAYTGYFQRLDLIGLNFVYTAAKGRGEEPWGPIAERVERGDTGMKSGRGFYEWPGDSAGEYQRSVNRELIRLMKRDMEAGTI